MALLIKNSNQKKNSSFFLLSTGFTTETTIAAAGSACANAITLDKNSTIKAATVKYPTTASLLSTSIVESASNVDDGRTFHSASSTITLSRLKKQPVELVQVRSESVAQASSSSLAGSDRKAFKTMPSFKIMSYQNFIALLTVLVCGLVTVNGLKCYMCGQYNEGVGSITPCLNYSEQYAHLYLKECSKKSEKYCVKYVSELSIVRDCATECAEKEIWETQTYCCTEDGCNGSNTLHASAFVIMLPLVIYILNEVMNIIKQQRR